MNASRSQLEFQRQFEERKMFYVRILESMEVLTAEQIKDTVDREYQYAESHLSSYFQELVVDHVVRIMKEVFAPDPPDDQKEEIEYGLRCVLESAELQFRGEKETEKYFKERGSAYDKSTWASVKKLLRCALNLDR